MGHGGGTSIYQLFPDPQVSPQFTVEDEPVEVCHRKTKQRAKKDLVPLEIKTRKSRAYSIRPVGLKFNDEDSPHISLYPSLAHNLLSGKTHDINSQLDSDRVCGDDSVGFTDESEGLGMDRDCSDDRVVGNTVHEDLCDQTVPDISMNLKISIASPLPMNMPPMRTSHAMDYSCYSDDKYQLSSSMQDLDETKPAVPGDKRSSDDETRLDLTESSSDDETRLDLTESSFDDETRLDLTDDNIHNLTTSVIELSDLVSNMSIEPSRPQLSCNPPLVADSKRSGSDTNSVKSNIFKPPSTSTPCRCDHSLSEHSLHLNTMASTLGCETAKLQSQSFELAQNSLISVRIQPSPSQPVSMATSSAPISCDHDFVLQVTESEDENGGCSILAHESPQHLWVTPEVRVIDNTFS